MDFRKRISIIVVIVVALVAAIILFFLLRRKPAGPGAPTVSPSAETPDKTVAAPASPIPALTKVPQENDGERYVRQLAGIFVERLGSYSNQDGNKHLDDAIALATERMAAWLRTQAVAAGQVYQGKTTHLVASKVESYAATAAKVHVDVQEENNGAAGSKTIYHSGRVELVKVDGVWKVGGLYWE